MVRLVWDPARLLRDKALDEFERRFGVEGLCNVKLGVPTNDEIPYRQGRPHGRAKQACHVQLWSKQTRLAIGAKVRLYDGEHLPFGDDCHN